MMEPLDFMDPEPPIDVQRLMAGEQERVMSESQTIADLFFADLMSCCKEIEQCFEPLYLAFGDGSGDSVFGVNTRPGYIFDDYFWDVFHAHPLHVCHVTRLTDGPQFDEGRVFEIRFKISEEQVALKAKLSKMEETLVEISEQEDETCGYCLGSGGRYADGDAHYPSENAPVVPCGQCGGSGKIPPPDARDLAASALAAEEEA